MNTTSVPIPTELFGQLEQTAHSQGVSMEQFVAVSLQAAVHRAQPHDTFFADDAVFPDRAPADLSLRHDDYPQGDVSTTDERLAALRKARGIWQERDDLPDFAELRQELNRF